MTPAQHEAVCYLQIKPNRHRWYPEHVVGLTPVRVTKSKPTTVAEGCIVVKVRIRIPDAAFEPLQPEAIIDVPEDLIQRPVSVTAEDPA